MVKKKEKIEGLEEKEVEKVKKLSLNQDDFADYGEFLAAKKALEKGE